MEPKQVIKWFDLDQENNVITLFVDKLYKDRKCHFADLFDCFFSKPNINHPFQKYTAAQQLRFFRNKPLYFKVLSDYVFLKNDFIKPTGHVYPKISCSVNFLLGCFDTLHYLDIKKVIMFIFDDVARYIYQIPCENERALMESIPNVLLTDIGKMTLTSPCEMRSTHVTQSDKMLLAMVCYLVLNGKTFREHLLKEMQNIAPFEFEALFKGSTAKQWNFLEEHIDCFRISGNEMVNLYEHYASFRYDYQAKASEGPPYCREAPPRKPRSAILRDIRARRARNSARKDPDASRQRQIEDALATRNLKFCTAVHFLLNCFESLHYLEMTETICFVLRDIATYLLGMSSSMRRETFQKVPSTTMDELGYLELLHQDKPGEPQKKEPIRLNLNLVSKDDLLLLFIVYYLSLHGRTHFEVLIKEARNRTPQVISMILTCASTPGQLAYLKKHSQFFRTDTEFHLQLPRTFVLPIISSSGESSDEGMPSNTGCQVSPVNESDEGSDSSEGDDSCASVDGNAATSDECEDTRLEDVVNGSFTGSDESREDILTSPRKGIGKTWMGEDCTSSCSLGDVKNSTTVERKTLAVVNSYADTASCSFANEEERFGGLSASGSFVKVVNERSSRNYEPKDKVSCMQEVDVKSSSKPSASRSFVNGVDREEELCRSRGNSICRDSAVGARESLVKSIDVSLIDASDLSVTDNFSKSGEDKDLNNEIESFFKDNRKSNTSPKEISKSAVGTQYENRTHDDDDENGWTCVKAKSSVKSCSAVSSGKVKKDFAIKRIMYASLYLLKFFSKPLTKSKFKFLKIILQVLQDILDYFSNLSLQNKVDLIQNSMAKCILKRGPSSLPVNHASILNQQDKQLLYSYCVTHFYGKCHYKKLYIEFFEVNKCKPELLTHCNKLMFFKNQKHLFVVDKEGYVKSCPLVDLELDHGFFAVVFQTYNPVAFSEIETHSITLNKKNDSPSKVNNDKNPEKTSSNLLCAVVDSKSRKSDTLEMAKKSLDYMQHCDRDTNTLTQETVAGTSNNSVGKVSTNDTLKKNDVQFLGKGTINKKNLGNRYTLLKLDEAQFDDVGNTSNKLETQDILPATLNNTVSKGVNDVSFNEVYTQYCAKRAISKKRSKNKKVALETVQAQFEEAEETSNTLETYGNLAATSSNKVIKRSRKVSLGKDDLAYGKYEASKNLMENNREPMEINDTNCFKFREILKRHGWDGDEKHTMGTKFISYFLNNYGHLDHLNIPKCILSDCQQLEKMWYGMSPIKKLEVYTYCISAIENVLHFICSESKKLATLPKKKLRVFYIVYYLFAHGKTPVTKLLTHLYSFYPYFIINEFIGPEDFRWLTYFKQYSPKYFELDSCQFLLLSSLFGRSNSDILDIMSGVENSYDSNIPPTQQAVTNTESRLLDQASSDCSKQCEDLSSLATHCSGDVLRRKSKCMGPTLACIPEETFSQQEVGKKADSRESKCSSPDSKFDSSSELATKAMSNHLNVKSETEHFKAKGVSVVQDGGKATEKKTERIEILDLTMNNSSTTLTPLNEEDNKTECFKPTEDISNSTSEQSETEHFKAKDGYEIQDRGKETEKKTERIEISNMKMNNSSTTLNYNINLNEDNKTECFKPTEDISTSTSNKKDSFNALKRMMKRKLQSKETNKAFPIAVSDALLSRSNSEALSIKIETNVIQVDVSTQVSPGLTNSDEKDISNSKTKGIENEIDFSKKLSLAPVPILHSNKHSKETLQSDAKNCSNMISYKSDYSPNSIRPNYFWLLNHKCSTKITDRLFDLDKSVVREELAKNDPVHDSHNITSIVGTLSVLPKDVTSEKTEANTTVIRYSDVINETEKSLKELDKGISTESSKVGADDIYDSDNINEAAKPPGLDKNENSEDIKVPTDSACSSDVAIKLEKECALVIPQVNAATLCKADKKVSESSSHLNKCVNSEITKINTKTVCISDVINEAKNTGFYTKTSTGKIEMNTDNVYNFYIKYEAENLSVVDKNQSTQGSEVSTVAVCKSDVIKPEKMSALVEDTITDNNTKTTINKYRSGDLTKELKKTSNFYARASSGDIKTITKDKSSEEEIKDCDVHNSDVAIQSGKTSALVEDKQESVSNVNESKKTTVLGKYHIAKESKVSTVFDSNVKRPSSWNEDCMEFEANSVVCNAPKKLDKCSSTAKMEVNTIADFKTVDKTSSSLKDNVMAKKHVESIAVVTTGTSKQLLSELAAKKQSVSDNAIISKKTEGNSVATCKEKVTAKKHVESIAVVTTGTSEQLLSEQALAAKKQAVLDKDIITKKAEGNTVATCNLNIAHIEHRKLVPKKVDIPEKVCIRVKTGMEFLLSNLECIPDLHLVNVVLHALYEARYAFLLLPQSDQVMLVGRILESYATKSLLDASVVLKLSTEQEQLLLYSYTLSHSNEMHFCEIENKLKEIQMKESADDYVKHPFTYFKTRSTFFVVCKAGYVKLKDFPSIKWKSDCLLSVNCVSLKEKENVMVTNPMLTFEKEMAADKRHPYKSVKPPQMIVTASLSKKETPGNSKLLKMEGTRTEKNIDKNMVANEGSLVNKLSDPETNSEKVAAKIVSTNEVLTEQTTAKAKTQPTEGKINVVSKKSSQSEHRTSSKETCIVKSADIEVSVRNIADKSPLKTNIEPKKITPTEKSAVTLTPSKKDITKPTEPKVEKIADPAQILMEGLSKTLHDSIVYLMKYFTLQANPWFLEVILHVVEGCAPFFDLTRSQQQKVLKESLRRFHINRQTISYTDTHAISKLNCRENSLLCLSYIIRLRGSMHYREVFKKYEEFVGKKISLSDSHKYWYFKARVGLFFISTSGHVNLVNVPVIKLDFKSVLESHKPRSKSVMDITTPRKNRNSSCDPKNLKLDSNLEKSCGQKADLPMQNFDEHLDKVKDSMTIKKQSTCTAREQMPSENKSTVTTSSLSYMQNTSLETKSQSPTEKRPHVKETISAIHARGSCETINKMSEERPPAKELDLSTHDLNNSCEIKSLLPTERTLVTPVDLISHTQVTSNTSRNKNLTMQGPVVTKFDADLDITASSNKEIIAPKSKITRDRVGARSETRRSANVIKDSSVQGNGQLTFDSVFASRLFKRIKESIFFLSESFRVVSIKQIMKTFFHVLRDVRNCFTDESDFYTNILKEMRSQFESERKRIQLQTKKSLVLLVSLTEEEKDLMVLICILIINGPLHHEKLCKEFDARGRDIQKTSCGNPYLYFEKKRLYFAINEKGDVSFIENQTLKIFRKSFQKYFLEEGDIGVASQKEMDKKPISEEWVGKVIVLIYKVCRDVLTFKNGQISFVCLQKEIDLQESSEISTTEESLASSFKKEYSVLSENSDSESDVKTHSYLILKEADIFPIKTKKRPVILKDSILTQTDKTLCSSPNGLSASDVIRSDVESKTSRAIQKDVSSVPNTIKSNYLQKGSDISNTTACNQANSVEMEVTTLPVGHKNACNNSSNSLNNSKLTSCDAFKVKKVHNEKSSSSANTSELVLSSDMCINDQTSSLSKVSVQIAPTPTTVLTEEKLSTDSEDFEKEEKFYSTRSIHSSAFVPCAIRNDSKLSQICDNNTNQRVPNLLEQKVIPDSVNSNAHLEGSPDCSCTKDSSKELKTLNFFVSILSKPKLGITVPVLVNMLASSPHEVQHYMACVYKNNVRRYLQNYATFYISPTSGAVYWRR